MIYFFNTDGRCIQKSSAIRSAHTDRDKAQIASQLRDLAPLGVDRYFVSLIDYDMDAIYFDQGRLKQRTAMPCTLDVTDPAQPILSNLPSPCTILVNGTAYEETETQVRFSLPYPMQYAIVVRAWPYFDNTFTVVVP